MLEVAKKYLEYGASLEAEAQPEIVEIDSKRECQLLFPFYINCNSSTSFTCSIFIQILSNK